MRVGNTASDLMSILQKKNDRKDDGTDKTNGFAAMLANFMGGAAAQKTAPSAPSTPTAPPEESKSPVESKASEQAAGVETEQPAASEKPKKWSEDMYEKMGTPGYLPKNIREAHNRTAVLGKQLEELLTKAMKDSNAPGYVGWSAHFVDGEYRIAPTMFNSGNYAKLIPGRLEDTPPGEMVKDTIIPTGPPEHNMTSKELWDFYEAIANTPEINALAEEYGINSAISRTALFSDEFSDQYDKNPEATLRENLHKKWGEMEADIFGSMWTSMITCNRYSE